MTSRSSSYLDLVLTVLGGLTVLWILLKAARGLVYRLRVYVLSEVWKGVDLASYGPWAVVTGATAGIGKAYAHELAKRGLNVVLISRSMKKLKHVAAEIEEQHGRSTRVIQMDFTEGLESYEPLRAALQGLEIGILVNNVGMAISKPVRFLDIPDFDKAGILGHLFLVALVFYITPLLQNNQEYFNDEQYYDCHLTHADLGTVHDMVNCNMLSVVKMTQIILPQMVARKKGIIINMSSASAQRPVPLVLMYSTTKRFMDIFSRGLDQEYGSKGIIVQSVVPFFVESNMTTSVTKYFKIPADMFARKALNTVGLSNRTSGCLTHSIAMFLINNIFPPWLHLSPIGDTVVSLILSILLKQD